MSSARLLLADHLRRLRRRRAWPSRTTATRAAAVAVGRSPTPAWSSAAAARAERERPRRREGTTIRRVASRHTVPTGAQPRAVGLRRDRRDERADRRRRRAGPAAIGVLDVERFRRAAHRNAGNVMRTSARTGAGRPRCTRRPRDPTAAAVMLHTCEPISSCASTTNTSASEPSSVGERRQPVGDVGERERDHLARVEPAALDRRPASSSRPATSRSSQRGSCVALVGGRRRRAPQREQRADRQPEAEPERGGDLGAREQVRADRRELRLPEVREIA